MPVALRLGEGWSCDYVFEVGAKTDVPRQDAVRRLAQYRPFDQGGHSLDAMLRDLVLAAAAINGGNSLIFKRVERVSMTCGASMWRLMSFELPVTGWKQLGQLSDGMVVSN